MRDEYLTSEFNGKSIEELLNFMHSLDDKMYWKGGILQEFQINEDYTYFIFVEEDKQNIIFVKCREYLKDKVELCGEVEDFDLAKMPYDLRVLVCNYEVVSVSSIKLESDLNEEKIKNEIKFL
jgi:hypothetical protein